MPKTGFTSITVPKIIYDDFHFKYTERKQILTRQGIRSFSAYISYIIQSFNDRIASTSSIEQVVKVVLLEKNKIVLYHVRMNDTFTFTIIKNNMIRCNGCKSNSCLHCGLALAVSEVLDHIGNQEI
ncbi:MAG: hypothetical protein K8823_1545 [Cenarchaeum symbiont of Oopsacas minuta]|nr:hypothetical protein [Cenarchaeum symbiont of Oopsacas minuta]